MNRIQNYPALKERIATWLSAYFEKTKMSCFVVGVSGGIDSAVVSTLAAETGKQVYVLNMPIHQKPEQEEKVSTFSLSMEPCGKKKRDSLS